MSLQNYKEQYNKLTVKKNLFGKEAEEKVKQDGFALQYVIKQTPKICELAVKQNGDALQFVEDKFFK